MDDVILKHVQPVLQLASNEGRWNVGFNSLDTLKRLSGGSGSAAPCSAALVFRHPLEESTLFWNRGEHHKALAILSNAISRIKAEVAVGAGAGHTRILSIALCMYGTWMAATQAASTHDIIEKYFKEAIACDKGSISMGADAVVNAYFSLAQVADQQYRLYRERIASPENAAAVLMRKGLQQQITTQVVNHRKSGVLSAEDSLAKRFKHEEAEEEAEEERSKQETLPLLILAVENYVICLRTSAHHDLQVFRAYPF